MKKHISAILIIFIFIIGGFFVNNNVIFADWKAPTLDFPDSPINIIAGDTVTLTWESHAAGSCTANGWLSEEHMFADPSALSGTVSVAPKSTTTYSMTCYSSNGGSGIWDQVDPKTGYGWSGGPISGHWKSSIGEGTWTSDAGATGSGSATWSGIGSGTFSNTFCPNASNCTYTTGTWDSFWFTGTGSTVTDEVTVNVTPAITEKPVVTIWLSIKKDSEGKIPFGSNFEVRWSSTDATSCTASGDWSGEKTTSGVGYYPVTNLTTPKTYNISCTNVFGTTNNSVKAEIGEPTCDSPSCSNKVSSEFFLTTEKETNSKATTATLNGIGGSLKYNPSIPLTAYFRYSRANISPVFCNDIYGTNMVATKDIILNKTNTNTSAKNKNIYDNKLVNEFSQDITGLKPDTTYYYCAIISNKNGIGYGGTNAVKFLHTPPLETKITTKDATRVTATTATLNGSFISTKNVKTYFEYQEDWTEASVSFNFIKNFISKIINTAIALDAPSILTAGEKNHAIGKLSNLSRDISVSLSKLSPGTTYSFTAVAQDCKNGATDIPTCTGDTLETFRGTSLNFTTKGNKCANGATDYPTCKKTTEDISCTLPYVLNSNKTECVYGCTSPSTFNYVSQECEKPLPVCHYPQILDLESKLCIDGDIPDNLFPVVNTTADESLLNSGESTTIRWTSTNTTSCDAGIEAEKSGIWDKEDESNSGTWVATTGTGGSGTANWQLTGSSGGTWTSTTGSGTWTTTAGKTTTEKSGTWGIGKYGKWKNNKFLTSGSFNTGALTESKSYSVTCTGDQGSGGDTVNIYVRNLNNVCTNGATNYPKCTIGTDGSCLNKATNPPACDGGDKLPTVTVKANPSSIDSGKSSIVSWTSTNATSCDSGIEAEKSGVWNKEDEPNSGTWVATTGTGGSGTANWQLTGSSGGTWTSTTGSGTWTTTTGTPTTEKSGTWGIGKYGKWKNNKFLTSGSFNTGALTESKSYSVTCTGDQGDGSGTATVFINGDSNNDKLPRITLLTATPSSINRGASSVIAWESENTTSCDTGIIPKTKSINLAAQAIKAPPSTTSGSFNTDALTASRAYTVTCIGGRGTTSRTVNVFVRNLNNVCTNGATNYPKCTVGPDGGCLNKATNPPACDIGGDNLPTVTVKADKSSLNSGESTIVRWESKNASSCDTGINIGIKSINLVSQIIKAILPTTSGSFDTSALTASKEFTVTCTGANGTASDTVNILVNGDPNNDKLPTVTVTANPSSLDSGKSSIVSWTSTNTTSCDVSDNNTVRSGTWNSTNWSSNDGGKSGTWNTTTDFGTWTAPLGSGGTGNANWIRITKNSGVWNKGLYFGFWTSDKSITTSGSFNTGALTASKAYTITCTGEKGTAAGTVNIYVNGANTCTNDATNYPKCTINTNGSCLNKATNPPACDDGGDTGGDNLPTVTIKVDKSSFTIEEVPATTTIHWESNYTDSCNTGINAAGISNGTGTKGSFKTDPLTKSRAYTVSCEGKQGTASKNVYVFVGDSNYNPRPNDPECLNGATNPPACTTNPTRCTNGAVNYPKCTIGPDGGCLNGASNPPECTTKPTKCINNATNYPKCTTNTDGDCLNGATNPPTCTTKPTRCTNGANNYPKCTTITKNNIGILNTTPLVLGQTATPPWDAIVRYHEGIETVLMRQIMADITFAKMYGYKEGNDLQTFAWDLADAFAKKFGYINTDRKEIRVSVPDRAAYQIQLIGDKLTIYEYFDYKIVDVRNLTTVFKSTSGYEYYFQK